MIIMLFVLINEIENWQFTQTKIHSQALCKKNIDTASIFPGFAIAASEFNPRCHK